MSDFPGFRADLARSVRLLRAFRTEQADSSGYYTVLAQDTIHQLSQYTYLSGQVVADVGGGPGFFVRELRAAGARAFCVDTDLGELAAQGRPEPGSTMGSALHLPLGTGLVDVCFSSNVLEHVPDWPAMLTEMVRVTRPGGIVFAAFTNWLSPWGGHETSPWHYLGGEWAATRYTRQHGSRLRTGLAKAFTRFRWRTSCAGLSPRKAPSWSMLCRATSLTGPGRCCAFPGCASS